jgi:hypothetical protein
MRIHSILDLLKRVRCSWLAKRLAYPSLGVELWKGELSSGQVVKAAEEHDDLLHTGELALLQNVDEIAVKHSILS